MVMWTCSLLKSNARQALSGRYWRSFWVCLVVTLLSGGYTSQKLTYSSEEVYGFLDRMPIATLLILLAASLLVLALAILWSVFFLSPLTVGSPVTGRREKFMKTNVGYDFINNRMVVSFSILTFDLYVRGTYRDYL